MQCWARKLAFQGTKTGLKNVKEPTQLVSFRFETKGWLFALEDVENLVEFATIQIHHARKRWCQKSVLHPKKTKAPWMKKAVTYACVSEYSKPQYSVSRATCASYFEKFTTPRFLWNTTLTAILVSKKFSGPYVDLKKFIRHYQLFSYLFKKTSVMFLWRCYQIFQTCRNFELSLQISIRNNKRKSKNLNENMLRF